MYCSNTILEGPPLVLRQAGHLHRDCQPIAIEGRHSIEPAFNPNGGRRLIGCLARYYVEAVVDAGRPASTSSSVP